MVYTCIVFINSIIRKYETFFFKDTHRFLLGGFAALAVSGIAGAQIPGHWEQVTIGGLYRPVAVSFFDSTSGIILADTGGSDLKPFYTTDGGISWNKSNDLIPIGDVPSYRPLEMLSRKEVFFTGDRGLSHSTDGGITWAFQIYPGEMDGRNGRMLDQDFGVFASGVALYGTINSGTSYYDIGNYPGAGDDVMAIDSLNIWLSASNTGETKAQLNHSTDGGASWTTQYPIDPNGCWRSCLEQIVTSPDPNYLYVIGAGINIGEANYIVNEDFIKSTDAGKTWVGDSVTGMRRLYRLASPARGVLWGLVGNSMPISGSVNTGIDDISLMPSIYGFPDSLFYSTDNGASWQKDSVTFIGDTLVGMSWPDANHGYVLGWKDSTMSCYRFILFTSGVSALASMLAPSLRILASPVSDQLKYVTSGIEGDADVRIFNILGEECYRTHVVVEDGITNSVDAHAFPSGYYILSLGSGTSQQLIKSFIKE